MNLVGLMLGRQLLWSVVVNASSFCSMDSYCKARWPEIGRYSNVTESGLHLRQVIVMTRHGDRTPIATIGGDQMDWEAMVDHHGLSNIPPVISDDIQVGLLTKRGARQQYQMGKALRAIYGKREVYLRSTRFTRTWLSCQYLAMGMTGKKKWRRAEMRPIQNESMLISESACPALKQVVREALNGGEFDELKEEMTSLELVAKENFKMEIAPLNWRKKLKGHYTPDGSKFFELADQFYCSSCHRSTLFGVKEDYRELGEQFCRVSRKAWKLTRAALASNLVHSRLRVGPLIKEILGWVKERNGFILLGAHDTTLVHLIGALDMGHDEWPAYASNLIIEVYEDKVRKTYLRFLYNDDLIHVPWAQPHLDGLIPLGDFATFVEPLLPLQGDCIA